MRQYSTVIIASLLLVAWQSAWPRWACLLGARPDLSIALVICVGMLRGPVAGAWTGLALGLLGSSLDAAAAGTGGGAPMGGLMLSHIGAGYIAGLLRAGMLADRPPVAGLVALVAVPVTRLVEMVFVPPAAFGPWLVVTLVQAPYTALATIPIYFALRPLLRETRQPPLPVV
jgi:hypothetical protein